MPQSNIDARQFAPKNTCLDPAVSPTQLRGVRQDFFTERPFPRLFEEQAANAPHKMAVFCDGRTLTFAELNARANQLARHLRTLGVGRESIVGICIDRSCEMAIGILGILKAGGAYLPLDPEYPTERLTFMLADAQPTLVLTKSDFITLFSASDTRTVLLDQDWPRISRESSENLSDGPSPDDLAYVIYTSGSTGRPKGAMITHGNLANYLLALNHELKIGVEDLYLHTASIAFSSSRRQLMLPLSQGAAVVIANSEQRKDPMALFAMIKQRGITVIDAVPSFWRNCTTILAGLGAEERTNLLDNQIRLILSASERLLSDIPQTWMKQFGHPARHVHMFGQTETAGIVCLYRIPEEIDSHIQRIPIGRPIANTEIYILDEQLQLCDAGQAGELYIGGAGVGRGYLNRGELTAERFIAHPQTGVRLYRTGDWARVREDGQIEFAGRRDQQIKLRGFRIEPGEIEVALAKHPLVRECVVVPRAGDGDDIKLIAYLVANETAPPAGELRRFLNTQLPEFLIPAAFVVIDALPLSANGKVDRLALPDSDQFSPQLSSEYVAPRNDTERRMAAIWRNVLRTERIGINDNFFELGGHSLLAAQVISRLRHEFTIEMPLRLLFEHPTIASLAAALENNENDRTPNWRIQPSERNGAAPLSFPQQQFWLLDQTALHRSAYNVRTAVRITGVLDVQKLQGVLQTIVARHEVLRTNIVTTSDSPIQVIAPPQAINLEFRDLGLLSSGDREAEIERICAVEAEVPFDLSQGPLLRFKLLKLSAVEHVLVITIHHIICDGWSIGLLHREIAALYAPGGELPKLPIQYADFALWQRRLLDGETLERQLDYWKQKLAGAPADLDLPTDFARPATRNMNGARISAKVPEALSNSLQELSRREGTTLFMTLLAAFQVLLYRYAKQEDIVVGSPVAGRSMLETENLIGAFVNTLVFRGDASGNPSFREFLARTRETVLGAFSHQDLPFEKLVAELNPERKIDRSPLFQVMFAMQNAPEPNLAGAGLKLTPLKLQNVSAKFDLSLDVEAEKDALQVSLEYKKELFAPETIERMLEHLQNLLAAIVADPAQHIGELPLLSDAERQRLLIEWNDTRVEFPADICLHQLFEAQVARTPNAIAAEFQGERLTYRELNKRANQLAHYLQEQGVGAEILVGICVERSLEMLVGILGVLKAGGAYVPLDPKYPRKRIAFMIEDAELRLVLTQQSLAKNIPSDHATVVCADDRLRSIAKQNEENPNFPVKATNLAYAIYTSGSTGNPKGVMIEHRQIVNFTLAAAQAYTIKGEDRILQFASLSFDLSAEEIYPALACGATIVLRTDAMISSARDFLRFCDEWKISVLDLPTAYWHDLTDALFAEKLTLPASLRLVIIGGERALPERVRAWKTSVGHSVRLVNSYGPTETTVAVTLWDVADDESDVVRTVLIGRPIANTTAYVLDQFLQPVPIGVAGELHLGGACVARGYIKRPELSADKFIANPFSKVEGAKLYKTGDLVRYRADGNIEFLGRVDNQIKIRGFRVELEEIEEALRSHASVSDCVVILREDTDGDKRLVAYVVAAKGSVAINELRNFLKTRLPSYMVPALFEMIESLPLMPNGKIDRRALPEANATRPEPDEFFVPPRTPLEAMLADAWRGVLKIDQIGTHENFFDLGGHSLLAAKVVSTVRNILDIELCMVDVFEAPTIAGLAVLLNTRGAQNDAQRELLALLEEVESLTEEAAQERFASETLIDEALVA